MRLIFFIDNNTNTADICINYRKFYYSTLEDKASEFGIFAIWAEMKAFNNV